MSTYHIPSNEFRFSFSRSSGPGGQNVNKTSTKVSLRWGVGKSAAFTEEQKQRIRTVLANRLTSTDEVMVNVSAERSQLQNKEKAIEQLEKLVATALRPRKPRRPTKPTRRAKEKRLDAKRRTSVTKRARRVMSEIV